MHPFPTEDTPDDLSGLDRPEAPRLEREPGHIRLAGLGPGHRAVLIAVTIVFIASFLPWYHAHVARAPGGSVTDPCPPSLHGTDRKTCEEESRAGQGISINHFTWAAWNTPRAWLAVLVVIVFGAILIRQVMPAYRPLPPMVIVGLAAVVDLFVLQAIVLLPSPGPDLDGHKVPGSQAWQVSWGIYVVLAGMCAMTIGVAVDYLRDQRNTTAAPAE